MKNVKSYNEFNQLNEGILKNTIIGSMFSIISLLPSKLDAQQLNYIQNIVVPVIVAGGQSKGSIYKIEDNDLIKSLNIFIDKMTQLMDNKNVNISNDMITMKNDLNFIINKINNGYIPEYSIKNIRIKNNEIIILLNNIIKQENINDVDINKFSKIDINNVSITELKNQYNILFNKLNNELKKDQKIHNESIKCDIIIIFILLFIIILMFLHALK